MKKYRIIKIMSGDKYHFIVQERWLFLCWVDWGTDYTSFTYQSLEEAEGAIAAHIGWQKTYSKKTVKYL